MKNLLHTKDDEYEDFQPEGEIGKYVTNIRVPRSRPLPRGCTDEMLRTPVSVNADGSRTYAVWVEWSQRAPERRAHVTMTKRVVEAAEARVAEAGASAKETADVQLRRSAHFLAQEVADRPSLGCTRRHGAVEWIDPEPPK